MARSCWIRRALWRMVAAEFPENSISAMTPDTHALKAISISESRTAGLLDNQASRQYRVRYASATLAAHATAISPYFNTFIASYFLDENPAAIEQRHSPTRDEHILQSEQDEGVPVCIGLVPRRLEFVPNGRP